VSEGPFPARTFADLMAQDRPREALRLLLGHLRNRPWGELEPADLSMLDQLCQKGLPQLLQHHTRWLLGDVGQLEHLAGLLECALGAQYRPAATLEQLAWVRCLLALSAAMRKDLDAAHEQMCRTQPGKADVPRPNGKLEQALQRLELLEGAAGGFLRPLFDVYFQCLHEMGRHEMANVLAAQVQKLIERIEEDEKRPGVVRGLFYNEQRKEGYTRLIHVVLSASAHEDSRIVYARLAIDQLDSVTQDASEVAMKAADAFLRRRGYPDGLQGRLVRWEISTVQGEPVDVPRSYTGASLGLPLAVAIVSAYVSQVVPNDTALTGALSGSSEDLADVLAVDGVEEKVRRAVAVGCRRVFVPAGNAAIFAGSPSLQHAAQAANATVRHVGRLDEACDELFGIEVKDTAGAILADTFRPGWRMVGLPRRKGSPSSREGWSHRGHVLLSAANLTAIFLLEGFKHHLAYAGDYPFGMATLRTMFSTMVAVAGLLVSYGLILACLRHRKDWAWLASIPILGAAMTGAVLILAPMLPTTTNLSTSTDWPVLASLAKDIFVLWLFAWILLTNTFAVVAGLEHLVDRHQYVTARRCLAGDSFLEGRMPVRALFFPWHWGLLAFFLVGVFLFALEFVYYAGLHRDVAGAYWETFLGIGRDLVLIVAAAEAMIFYRVALAQIRKALL